MKRNNRGQFTSKRSSYIQRLFPLWLMVVTVIASYTVQTGAVKAEGVDQQVAEAGQTVELSPTPSLVAPTPSPMPILTQKQQIIDEIVRVFGDDSAEAIAIVRTCENKSFNPKADHWNSNGTWDAGIFMVNQIHGYSMEEMKDYKKNTQAAKKIFDNRGWSAWACSYQVGVKSFWE